METYLQNVKESGYAAPLVGDIDTLPIGESLIVLPNLGIDDRMRLSKDSILLLRELPYKHHVFLQTWP